MLGLLIATNGYMVSPIARPALAVQRTNPIAMQAPAGMVDDLATSDAYLRGRATAGHAQVAPGGRDDEHLTQRGSSKGGH